MHAIFPVILAALLFAAGVYGVLARRNTILVLMSVELMLAAVNLNLVTFDVWYRDQLHAGQVMALFVVAIAAAEAGLGLAIILLVFRHQQTVALDRLRLLSDAPAPHAPAEPATPTEPVTPVPAPSPVTPAATPVTPVPAPSPVPAVEEAHR
jgi:NADH-quinone oxidoreductase subunit K